MNAVITSTETSKQAFANHLFNPGARAPSPTGRLDNGMTFGERLRQRESGALEHFFDLYFDRMYSYVRGLVPDMHAAEDITQDIFLKLYRALPNYDPDRDLRPWVFTIASNTVRDHWRMRSNQEAQRAANLDDEAAHLSAGPERPESELERRERDERVRAAVYQLPVGMRTVLMLRIYDNLSFETIGQIINQSATAARKRYSRALHALRGIIEPAPVTRGPQLRFIG